MGSFRTRLARFFGSRRFLMYMAAAALVVRVAWAASSGDVHRFHDSDSYIKIADSLRAGNGFLWGDEATGQRMGRPPLYPLVVAATRYHLFGRQFLLLYLVQAILGVGAVLLFASGARRLVGKITGGLTALVLAFDPFLVFYCGEVLSETLFIFFFAALFYGVTLILARAALPAALMAGAAAGAAFLTRPSVPGVVALFAVGIVVWGRPRWKSAAALAAMAAAAFLVVLPWGVRNHRLTGHWIFTTLGVGASLYDGVGPQADGSSNMDFLNSMPELAKMSEYERDTYLTEKAVGSIVDSPGRVAGLAWTKVARFWSPVPNSGDFQRPLYVAASLAAVLPVYVLAFAALFAGVLRRRDFFVLASAPVYFTLVHMVFVGSTRYRTPVMPLIAMIAAALVAAYLSRGKKGLGAAHRRERVEHARLHPYHKKHRSHKRRGLRRLFTVLVLLLALAGVAGAAGYAFYARWLANPENVRRLAAQKIRLLFPGKSVKVANAEFSLFGGLELFDVQVLDKRNAKAPIARLGHVHIDFDHRRYARLKLTPKSVTASDLFLDLQRDENGKWNLAMPAAPGEASAEEALTGPFSLRLSGAFISLDDRYDKYSVSFPVDEISASSDVDNLHRWQLAATFGGPLLGKWRVTARGDADKNEFEAQFGIIDLDLGEGLPDRLPPVARGAYGLFSPSGRATVSGKLSYAQEAGWDCDILAALEDCAISYVHFPAPVKDLVGKLRFTPNGCTILGSISRSLGGAVACTGNIDGYGADAGFHLKIISTGIEPGEDLKKALSPRVWRGIEAFSPRGKFDVTTEVDSPVGIKMPVAVSMDIYPRGASAVFSGFPYEIDGLEGHLTYASNTLGIDAVSGRHGQAELLFSGSASRLDEAPNINIRVLAKNLPLDETLLAVVPEKVRTVWRSLKLTGVSDADMTLVKAGGAESDIDLDLRLRDTSVTPEWFPYELAGGEGHVAYKKGVVDIDHVTFTHGGGGLSVEGKVEADSGAFKINLAAANVVIDRELTDALPKAASDFLRRLGLAGVGDAALTISRDAGGEAAFSSVSGKLRSASLEAPELPVGLGAAAFSFVYGDGEISVSGVQAALFADNALALLPVARLAVLARPRTYVAADGTMPVGNRSRAWQMRFNATKLLIGDGLVASLPAAARDLVRERRIHGLADVEGTVARSAEDAGSADYRMSFNCADAGFFVGWEIADLKGKVDVAGRSGAASNAFSARGDLESFSLAARQMGRTQCEMTTEAGEARLTSLTTTMLGGTLTGQGHVRLESPYAYGFTAAVRAMSLPEMVDKAFGFHKEGLTGKVDGHLNLLCATGESCDIIGSAEASITEGTLWEVPLIFVVMNILDLSPPARTQFDRAHVRLNFAGDRMLVDELSMSSQPATIFGTGTILYTGALDLMVYAQPGQIPIVSMIAGEVGKNIVRTHVTGSFSDPAVMLVPSGPFGKLLDWLKSQNPGGG